MNDRPLTIGEIIDELKKCNNEATVFVCGTLPVQLDGSIGSWRGDYEQVALGYVMYGELKRTPVTVGELKTLLDMEIGKTETGWKGGKFVMSRLTQVWLDNRGDACNHAIVRAHVSSRGSEFYLDVKHLDRLG